MKIFRRTKCESKAKMCKGGKNCEDIEIARGAMKERIASSVELCVDNKNKIIPEMWDRNNSVSSSFII